MKRFGPGLVGLLVVASLFAACAKSDYQAMWALLTDESKARVGEDGFIARLPRIAEEMTLKSLEATIGAVVHLTGPNGSPDPRKATAQLSVTFHTQRVGDFKRDTFLSLVMVGDKDKAAWKIDWTPEAILQHLLTGRL